MVSIKTNQKGVPHKNQLLPVAGVGSPACRCRRRLQAGVATQAACSVYSKGPTLSTLSAEYGLQCRGEGLWGCFVVGVASANSRGFPADRFEHSGLEHWLP